MTEHDDAGTRLAAALFAEAETVRPEPALHSILARTRSAPVRRRSTVWWPSLVGAVAAGALVALAIVVFGGERTTEPPVAGGDAAEREVTVYYLANGDPIQDYDSARLFPQTVTTQDTGDPGLDAVNALLDSVPLDPDYSNSWSSLSEVSDSVLHLIAPVVARSVTEESGDITVDFSGPVDNPWDATIDWSVDPAFFSQQLVWTVQDALDTAGLVVVTMNGEPVQRVLTARVDNPMQRDPDLLAPVQIQSPAQGETVSSPVTVSGQSATFEGNVVWRVKQDGKVVDHGFVQSQGANGVFGPFQFPVDLPPGDYTVEAYEESAENGDIINLDSKDFTVE